MVEKIRHLRTRYANSLAQFIKFGIVGAAGLVVNMVVAILMNKANGGTVAAQRVLWSIPGTNYNVRFTALVWVVAFFVAVLFNFVLNRYWTFQHGEKAPFLKEFVPFFLVGSVAAFVGLFLKIAFTNPSSMIYLPDPWFHENFGFRSREYWAQLLTIILTMPINFVVNKLWTFRAVRQRHMDRVAT